MKYPNPVIRNAATERESFNGKVKTLPHEVEVIVWLDVHGNMNIRSTRYTYRHPRSGDQTTMAYIQGTGNVVAMLEEMGLNSIDDFDRGYAVSAAMHEERHHLLHMEAVEYHGLEAEDVFDVVE